MSFTFETRKKATDVFMVYSFSFVSSDENLFVFVEFLVKLTISVTFQ